MKKISEHLGEIIVALASVALLISTVVFFKAPIGDFFSNIVQKEVAVGDKIVVDVEGVDLMGLSSDYKQASATGRCLLLSNVFSKQPNLKVNLSSDTITDFSAVEVSRYGSNLLNISEMIGRDLVDNGDGTYTLTHNSGSYARSETLDVYIPANTTIYFSADFVDGNLSESGLAMTLRFADGTSKGVIIFDINSHTPDPNDMFALQKDLVGVQFVTMSGKSNIGEYVTFKAPQINIDQKLPYEKYIAPQTVTANADGKVEGLIPLSPYMTIITQNTDVTIECEYRKVKLTFDLEGKTIVNFGDSIFGYKRPPRDISTHLANLTDATVYNLGFGGCKMATHSAQWDAYSMYRLADSVATSNWALQDDAISNPSLSKPDYFAPNIELLKSIDFNDVDIITIAYGTNDFTTSTMLDDAEDPQNTATIAGALRYSIETISEAYPHIEIVICTPIYRYWVDDAGNVLYDSNTNVVNGCKLTDVCEIMKSVANEYNLICIDNYNNCGISESNREACLVDGTHPTITGCRLVAEHMAKELYKAFK